jgi:PAS domain S-box-containing protein
VVRHRRPTHAGGIRGELRFEFFRFSYFRKTISPDDGKLFFSPLSLHEFPYRLPPCLVVSFFFCAVSHLPKQRDVKKRPKSIVSKEPRASKRPGTPKGSINTGTDQFRLLVQSVLDYAIFMLDEKGRVATWNAGAERIKGYRPEEIIGKHFSIFYPEQDITSGKPQHELEIAEREGHFEEEGWRVRKDGTMFWANVIITAIRDDRGKLIGFGKVTGDFTERKRHEEELARSEALFRLLVEGARDYAIYMMDPLGHVTSWNAGAERIKGYSAPEIIGRHYSTFFPDEDVKAGKPLEILATAEREGSVEQEGWRVRKDGSRFWVDAIVTALRDDSGKLLGFSKITRDATERMRHQEALQNEIAEKEKAQRELSKSEQSLRRLSLSLLRSQDEERRRIGREMHDSLGQYLTALKMKLGVLCAKQPDPTAAFTDQLEQCNVLLEECVKEVRTISYLLYPPMLEEMGLKSAIPWYLDGFAQRSGIKTAFEITEGFGRAPRDVELAMFRVLQESLTNAHKHSGSVKVEIKMSRNHATLHLQVRDYGKGLPQAIAAGAPTQGVGLRGMNERMIQIGGTLTVTNAQPGTLVHATAPTQQLPDSTTNS